MGKKFPQYCAVIRTLGTAGEKYQTLLNSLIQQTHKPKRIIVYLAEGYCKPKETVEIEEIVYVKKGMVAQRALQYNEVDTEWMLLLDDDLSIENDGVERLFEALLDNEADVIAYDPFPHDKMPVSQKIVMSLLLTAIPRPFSRNKGYTVNCIGTDCYNNNPKLVGWSTTNSGAAVLCRKKNFLSIHFEDDLWLDKSPYALPEDKVMFYKFHLKGFKILTHYDAGFTHLDAGTSMTADREAKIAYSGVRNNRIFYKLYVEPYLTKKELILAKVLKLYQRCIFFIYNMLKYRGKDAYSLQRKMGVKDADEYLSNINQDNNF